MSGRGKGGKGGLGKSGAKRHRKLLHDNVQGITRPAIRRLANRAGIERCSTGVYEETRDLIKQALERILSKVVVFTQTARRRTIKVEDLENALELMGIHLLAKHDISGCGNPAPKKKNDDGEEKRAHRFRPGTRTRQHIRYQQKNSDCLAFRKLSFERLVREVAQEYIEDVNFAKLVFPTIQLVIETHLTRFFEKAGLCVKHADRTTLTTKDVQLVRRVSEDPLFSANPVSCF